MEVTGEMLKDTWHKDPSYLSHILAESLRSLGHKITDSEVQRITQNMIDGKEANTVAELIIHNWLNNGM